MQALTNRLNQFRKIVQNAGPYLLLEILLPGGSLCALLLFLWQRRNPQARARARRAVEALLQTFAAACEPRLWIPAPARTAIRLAKASSIERR
jgi:hypothetical protein